MSTDSLIPSFPLNLSGGLVWGLRDWNVGVASRVSGLEPARPNTFAWANFARAELG